MYHPGYVIGSRNRTHSSTMDQSSTGLRYKRISTDYNGPVIIVDSGECIADLLCTVRRIFDHEIMKDSRSKGKRSDSGDQLSLFQTDPSSDRRE